MSMIDILGYGVLRWPEAEGRPEPTGMVALHHPATEHRLTLVHVPVGKVGLLVAVLDLDAWPDLAAMPGLHAQDATEVSVVLATGTVEANQPASGIGPADLVGCAPTGTTWCWLDHDAVGLAADRDVRLEIHRGCTCAATAHSTTPTSVVSMATNPTGNE